MNQHNSPAWHTYHPAKSLPLSLWRLSDGAMRICCMWAGIVLTGGALQRLAGGCVRTPKSGPLGWRWIRDGGWHGDWLGESLLVLSPCAISIFLPTVAAQDVNLGTNASCPSVEFGTGRRRKKKQLTINGITFCAVLDSKGHSQSTIRLSCMTWSLATGVNEWRKIYRWCKTISTQNNVCSQWQVPPQAKNTITLGQYNPQKLTPKIQDQNHRHT